MGLKDLFSSKVSTSNKKFRESLSVDDRDFLIKIFGLIEVGTDTEGEKVYTVTPYVLRDVDKLQDISTFIKRHKLNIDFNDKYELARFLANYVGYQVYLDLNPVVDRYGFVKVIGVSNISLLLSNLGHNRDIKSSVGIPLSKEKLAVEKGQNNIIVTHRYVPRKQVIFPIYSINIDMDYSFSWNVEKVETFNTYDVDDVDTKKEYFEVLNNTDVDFTYKYLCGSKYIDAHKQIICQKGELDSIRLTGRWINKPEDTEQFYLVTGKWMETYSGIEPTPLDLLNA